MSTVTESSEKKSVLPENINELVDATKCPSGYTKVELSTKGYFGAPEVFHVRNFSTEELLILGQSDEDDYVEHLIEALQAIIWEKDVDIKKFHEKEVIELLILLYRTFYTKVIPNMTYELYDADYDYLGDIYKGKDTAEYKQRILDLENGRENPVFDLMLDSISFKEAKQQNTAYITKPDGFSCKFGFPCLGDTLLLKDYTELMFKNEDKQFEKIRKIYKLRRKAEDEAFRGKDIDLRNIGDITDADKAKLKEYEKKRSLFLIRGATAQYLREYKGEDVSNLTLDKRMAIVANDPDFDYLTFKKFSEAFKENVEPGPVEKIKCFSPIQRRTVERPYTFQLVSLLKAFTVGDTDKTSIEFV